MLEQHRLQFTGEGQKKSTVGTSPTGTQQKIGSTSLHDFINYLNIIFYVLQICNNLLYH